MERHGYEWLQTLLGVDNASRVLILSFAIRFPPSRALNQMSAANAVGNGQQDMRFLDDICIVEGSVDPLQDADMGQVKMYAGLQARLLTNPAFHRLATFKPGKVRFALFKWWRIHIRDREPALSALHYPWCRWEWSGVPCFSRCCRVD